jgi:NifU homolog involved in Fe-S cluster formation
MSLNEDLYKEIIIEYSQNPKHYGELPEANIHEEGVNRSCGDEVQLHLLVKDDKLFKRNIQDKVVVFVWLRQR